MPDGLRLVYISHSYNTHDRDFLEQIVSAGCEVWFQPCRQSAIALEMRHVPDGVHHLPPLWRNSRGSGVIELLVSLARLRRLIGRVRPQLVHAGPVQGGAFLAALAGCRPLLVMSWGSDVLVSAQSSWWMRRVTRFTLRRADSVLGDCRVVRDRILSLSGLPAEKVVWFPWGVDCSRFLKRPSTLGLRRRLGWQNCQVVISTRSFEPIHGTLVFLEAMRQAMASHPQLRVIMLGDGSLRSQVEQFLHANNLADKFYAPGQAPREQLPDYFNEADVYAGATLSDGSSISLLEAMACGLPVVVADAYGNREWVTPGINGWLYPANDASALASAIGRVLGESRQWPKMADANRALILERADWARNIRQLFSAYGRLTGTAFGRKERILPEPAMIGAAGKIAG